MINKENNKLKRTVSNKLSLIVIYKRVSNKLGIEVLCIFTWEVAYMNIWIGVDTAFSWTQLCVGHSKELNTVLWLDE